MKTEITDIQLGLNHCYLIKQKGMIMVDAGLPFTLKPRTPIYANYPDELNNSWKKLIAENVKMVFPGHGKAFPIERIKPYIT
jgi:glyoxylase-like metal-dependent hydrolase (beta-lactamase superfamily II)